MTTSKQTNVVVSQSQTNYLWDCRVQVADVCAHAAVGDHVRKVGRDGGLDHKHALAVEVDEPPALAVDGEAPGKVRIRRDGPEEPLLERLIGRRRRGVGEHNGDEDVQGGAVEDCQRDLLAGERVRRGVHRLQHRAARNLHY